MAKQLTAKGARPSHDPDIDRDPSGRITSTCALFESCVAPLCPLDAASLKGVWYADEEICRSRTYASLAWIRGQRKIGRVRAGGYFTLEMLRRNCIVKKGIAGLDADAAELSGKLDTGHAGHIYPADRGQIPHPIPRAPTNQKTVRNRSRPVRCRAHRRALLRSWRAGQARREIR